MRSKIALLTSLTGFLFGYAVQAQTVAPERLTKPMEFAGALIGAEIMLIEYSKSLCGPLEGRRFGVQEAVNIAAPYLSPSERKVLGEYVRQQAPQLHHEYQRLTGESLRTMRKDGMPIKDACTVLLNVYDKAYRTAKQALETSRP